MRPRTTFGRTLAVSFTVIALSLLSRGAEAGDVGDKARCRASYEQAQTLRRQEELSSARAQLVICRETCPEALVRDCTKWLAEVDALMPTVRLTANDRAGNALSGVQISVDGQAVLDGGTLRAEEAVRVSPGTHLFRFEKADFEPAEVRVDVHAGERDHPIAVVLSPVRAIAPSSPPSKTPALVAFGLGGALLVASGVITVKGHVDRSELAATCAPFCDQSSIDSVRTLFWTAGGLAIGGAVGALVGIVLFPKESRSLHEPLRTGLAVTPRSVALTVRFP